mmetsp:Transcript_23218/g.53918  ORF Transcript_23218/g.53918 Transcript_23218/m.53918 type:complete len:539 (-) Transcript_23218:709-2325(-)
MLAAARALEMTPQLLEEASLSSVAALEGIPLEWGAPRSPRGQVDVRGSHPRFRDGLDEEGRAEHPSIVHGVGALIRRKIKPEGPHDRRSESVGAVKLRVEVWHNGVPGANRTSDPAHRLLTKQPGLPARCVDVCMTAEEGRVGSGLVPPHHELRFGIVEEATNISTTELDTSHGKLEQHRRSSSEMLPLCHVVASPDSNVPLRPCIKGPGQDERPAIGTQDVVASKGSHRHVETILVVNIPVLDIPRMFEILLHSNFGAVEYRWLIHVVPRVQLGGAPDVVFRLEPRRPIVPHLGRKVVKPRATPGPAVPLEVTPISCPYEVSQFFGLGEDRISLVRLEVRVDNRDHLATAGCKVLLHTLGVRKQMPVPCHVTLANRVLDIEPDDIIRDIMLIKLGIHALHVLLVLVVPPALVVPQGEQWRHELSPNEQRKLPLDLRRGFSRHDENVNHSALRKPMRVLAIGRILHINHGLSRVKPQQASRVLGRVGEHERNSAVQRLMSSVWSDIILKNIQVVQTVWLIASSASPLAVSEGEGGGSL